MEGLGGYREAGRDPVTKYSRVLPPSPNSWMMGAVDLLIHVGVVESNIPEPILPGALVLARVAVERTGRVVAGVGLGTRIPSGVAFQGGEVGLGVGPVPCVLGRDRQVPSRRLVRKLLQQVAEEYPGCPGLQAGDLRAPKPQELRPWIPFAGLVPDIE